MRIGRDDSLNLFEALRLTFSFPDSVKDPEVLPLDQRYGSPSPVSTGFTASFQIRHSNMLQPLVFTFFPYDDPEWTAAARDVFEFEAECWKRWARTEQGGTNDVAPFRQHTPPPSWLAVANRTGKKNGTDISLIGCHTARLADGISESPVLVRPYVPWPTAREQKFSDDAIAEGLRRTVTRIIDRVEEARMAPPRSSTRHIDLSPDHVLTSAGRFVPTRWRTFHRLYWGFGLSKEQREGTE